MIVDLAHLPDARTRDSLCRKFHEEVYREAFPLADEAEAPEIWLPLLDPVRPAPEPAPLLHLLVARDGARIVAGHAIEYYRRSGCALGTYLAIRPGARGTGLARRLIDRGLEAVAEDARRLGRDAPLVFGEIEDPDRVPAGASPVSPRARLRAVGALGFLRVDVPYVQPPLGTGKRAVDWLHLLVHARGLPDPARLEREPLLAFLHEFHRALGIDDPERADSFARVARALEGRDAAPLIPLGAAIR